MVHFVLIMGTSSSDENWEIFDLYSLTFPTFTFRMVLKFVQNVPKAIMIIIRKKRINVRVTRRRVWKNLPVHGQTRKHYSF